MSKEETPVNTSRSIVIIEQNSRFVASGDDTPSTLSRNRRKLFKNVFRMVRVDHIRPRRSITGLSWVEASQLKFESQNPLFRFASHQPPKTEVLSLPLPYTQESESTSKSKHVEHVECSLLRKFYYNLEKYFEHTTLHGLRYVGDPSISFGERLFWLISFICAICFSAYFINNIYEKFDMNPVIMSLNPTPTQLETLPFPAVTICNMNQATRTEAERILNHGTEVERMLLDDYCDINTTSANSTNWDSATKWNNVVNFIIKVNPSCTDMIKSCLWTTREMDCEYIFNAAITDAGFCCTFNQLPKNYIFRNPKEMSDLNITFPPDVDDWSPETGYSNNSTATTFPWKAQGAGTQMGLTLVLDVGIHNYFCSSESSVGFKILLHNPMETPKMADYATLIPPKKETRITITPRIYDATQTLRSIDVAKRNCYFANERSLKYYRTYTQRNCKLECETNYTLGRCDCVPVFLPKSMLTKICNKQQELCSHQAKEEMERVADGAISCHCLPGCFELSFDNSRSFANLSPHIRLKEPLSKNETPEYTAENMAIVSIFFLDTSFIRYTKSELYGFSEFLSNTGGLLGLFLGFSFLSAVEVVYYLTLRILCSLVRPHLHKKIKTNKDLATVYPFAK